MKTINKLICTATILVGLITNANAQSTASAVTTATLVRPIAILKTADMNFGTLAASSTAGTVLLDYADAVTTPTTAVTLLGGTISTATFDVSGEGTSVIAVTTPTSVTISNGTDNMIVNGITVEQGATPSLVANALTLKVKATLNVNADQPAGVYVNTPGSATATTGLYVTVNYN